jgi:hypothetical protein
MQRLFRSDDDSKFIIRYGNASAGNKVYSTSKTLDSTDGFYNSAITADEGEYTGQTSLAEGTYNLPCKIVQSQGVGSNAVPNYEFNQLISVDEDGVATFLLPITKDFVTGAQIVTSNNWLNVTTANGVSLTVPQWDGSKGGEFFMVGRGGFVQVGSGNVDLRGKGFRRGVVNTTNNDGGGYGGEGLAGYSGAGGWNPTTSPEGQAPSGGGYGGGSFFGTGASGATNYTGGGGGGGAKYQQGDESAGGGGGGGNLHGGGGGGAGTDSNGSGGAGGASNSVGGGNGGTGLNGAGSASGSKATNVSGNGGNGRDGAGALGGGGGGGANAITNSELKAMHMGGGGGAGGNYWDNTGASLKTGGNGGNGAGCSTIIFPTITLTGGVLTTGQQGTGSENRGGGGGSGAGGDQRFIGKYIDLGNNCNANGVAGLDPLFGGGGGASSKASIHVDYLVSVAGTTTPTASTRNDLSITNDKGGAFLHHFM